MPYGEKPQSHAIDISHASDARVHDWLLGGTENYEVDRVACRSLLGIAPTSQEVARSSRTFLRRAVQHLAADKGISQFLDYGAGLPARHNVHDVAQGARPGARVVYIDNDPTVLACARTTLDDNEDVMVLDYDMRSRRTIKSDTRKFLDWDKPIAALLVSVLHCLPDTGDEHDPAAVVRAIAEQLPPGSYMVICHLVSDDPAIRDDVTRLMTEATAGQWGRVREHDEVRRYFDPLTIEDPPGLLDVADWHSATPPAHPRPADWTAWGGIGRVIR